ncbi:MAG: hypothetical protein H0U98_00355 [Alphaproteobacteria bacterium]|nr:hypothetical protein [Alphaproteobacteria bacterium]
MPVRKIVLPLMLMLASPAAAQGGAPPSWPAGNAEMTLGGEAGGAVFAPHQPGRDGIQASGVVRALPRLQRDFDTGLSLGLDAAIALADPLSRGRYDGDAIERLAVTARTGLGKIEIGIADGAGYALAVGGPKVDAGVSLEDPRTSFYRDPRDGRAVINLFALRTEVGASSNYAKFVYTSPPVFGATLALSFTPTQGKQLPFLNAGPHLTGRQADFWEAALRYETEIGALSLTGYGAVAESRGEHKLPGQEGTSDISFGLRGDYPLTDEIKFSLGGSWRQSNAYGFNVDQSWQPSTTRGQHVSAALSRGDWTAGMEYGNGVAKEVVIAGLPRLGLNGAQASLGYHLSSSVDLSGGYQHLSYGRSSGTFFNGVRQLKLDAVYLHLNLHSSRDE